MRSILKSLLRYMLRDSTLVLHRNSLRFFVISETLAILLRGTEKVIATKACGSKKVTHPCPNAT